MFRADAYPPRRLSRPDHDPSCSRRRSSDETHTSSSFPTPQTQCFCFVADCCISRERLVLQVCVKTLHSTNVHLASCSLPIIIPGIPPSGTKSRVETQVRVTVDLAHASSSAGQYDRVGSWKWLQLPKGTATKKRTRKEGKIRAFLPRCSALIFLELMAFHLEPTPEETLHLTVEVTCASAPHMRVVCCSNCQNREVRLTHCLIRSSRLS